MKRLAVIGLVSAVVLAASLTASAQGLMGFPAGMLSSVPVAGLFGQSLGGCDQGIPYGFKPTVYLGYVTHRNGVNIHTDFFQEDFFEDISDPLRGLWLGASVSLFAGDGFGVVAGAGALVPWNSRAHDDTTDAGVTIGYSPRPHNQWSIVEALATYQVYGGLKLLGGFRWDHFATKLTYSDFPAGDLHYTINAYLPVVGLESQVGTAGTSASAGIMGFPTVPGNFTYEYNSPASLVSNHEESSQAWNRGYFLECFLRFSHRVSGNTAMGAFATYNVLHAVTGQGSYDWQLPPVSGTNGLEYVFHRQSWTFGGSLAVEFFTL